MPTAIRPLRAPMTDCRCTSLMTTCSTASAAETPIVRLRLLVTTNNTPGSIDSMTPRGPPMASMTEKSSPSPAAARDAIPVRFFWF